MSAFNKSVWRYIEYREIFFTIFIVEEFFQYRHMGLDHKTTLEWAWPGAIDQISKFLDPVITLERIEQSASNLLQRWRTDHSCV